MTSDRHWIPEQPTRSRAEVFRPDRQKEWTIPMVPPLAGDLRIAYFITSYGSGEQLHHLVSTLRKADPGCPIVIHHDVFQSMLDSALFDDLPDVHVLTSDHPIVWGDMTLEAARWRVFRWIIDNVDADWVMLLSEQDYPIAPISELRTRFVSSGVDAFIRGQRVDQIESPRLRHQCSVRYLYQYASLPNLKIARRLPARWQTRLGRLRETLYAALARLQSRVFIYKTADALQLPSRIGLRQVKTPFSPEFPCWFNDCWFAVSRKSMEHVVAFLDHNPEFIRYYERTIIPLESATATILFNDPELSVENVSLHAIRWSDSTTGRPDVFGLNDLDELRNSGAAFARKFDLKETAVFDALDKVVLRDPQEAL